MSEQLRDVASNVESLEMKFRIRVGIEFKNFNSFFADGNR